MIRGARPPTAEVREVQAWMEPEHKTCNNSQWTHTRKKEMCCFKPLSFGEWSVSYCSITWPILTSTVPEWVNEWKNTIHRHTQYILNLASASAALATTSQLRFVLSQWENKTRVMARTVSPGGRIYGKAKDLLTISHVQPNSITRSHRQHTPCQSKLFA